MSATCQGCGGRAWVDEGTFFFKRRFMGGRKEITIRLDQIANVELGGATADEHIRSGAYANLRIAGTNGAVLASIPNLIPWEGARLYKFLVHQWTVRPRPCCRCGDPVPNQQIWCSSCTEALQTTQLDPSTRAEVQHFIEGVQAAYREHNAEKLLQCYWSDALIHLEDDRSVNLTAVAESLRPLLSHPGSLTRAVDAVYEDGDRIWITWKTLLNETPLPRTVQALRFRDNKAAEAWSFQR